MLVAGGVFLPALERLLACLISAAVAEDFTRSLSFLTMAATGVVGVVGLGALGLACVPPPTEPTCAAWL